MNRFLYEILKYSILLGGLIFLIKSSLPYYWGNDILGEKIEYLKSQPKRYDIFFIGSSEVYRSINPLIFDSICNTNSFNLGVPGMFYSEMEYTIQHLIDDYFTQRDFILIFRKTKPPKIKEKDLHTTEKKYYVDYSRLKSAVLFFYKNKDFKQIKNYSLHFIENKLGVGEYIDIIKFHFSDEKQLPFDILVEKKGFYSTDYELKREKSGNLIKRKEKFIKDLKNGDFKKRVAKMTKIIELKNEQLPFKFENTNIKFLQNRGSLIIEHQYFFDNNHYNNEGAKLYTLNLAKAFNKIAHK